MGGTLKDTALLSVSETIRHLEAAGRPRTRTAIMRRINDGRLPAMKVGTQWTIRRSDADALIATLNEGRAAHS
jgi:hypothetical protein